MSATAYIESKIKKTAKKQGVIPAAINELVAHAGEFRINEVGKVRNIAEPDMSVKKFVRIKLAERPEIVGTPEVSKKGDNPWKAANWNVTRQGSVMKADPALAARLAKAAGSFIGATKPAK